MKYEFTKKFELSEQDIIDLIDMALEGGIGYWCCLDNSTEDWTSIRKEYPEACIDERFYHLLKQNKKIHLIDEEGETDYYLDMKALLVGIQTAIDRDYWDGDMDSADAFTGDAIFQCAIFDDLIYG